MEPVADLVELVCDSDSVYAIEACRTETETGREAQAQATWDLPSDEWRKVMGSLAQRESAGIAEAAVCFSSDNEVIRAKCARTGRRSAPKWTHDARRVSE